MNDLPRYIVKRAAQTIGLQQLTKILDTKIKPWQHSQMSTEYQSWLAKSAKPEVAPGLTVWASEGAFAHRLCTVVSVNGDRALIRSMRSGGLDWVDKNSLDTETIIT